MKKALSFITLSLVVFLAVFSLAHKSALADGMVLRYDPYSDRWDFSNESSQQAFINYDNGLQKMIISIGFEEGNSNGAVWLFPIPSEPNKVAIDVVERLPAGLGGAEITKEAKGDLDYIMGLFYTTLIRPVPFYVACEFCQVNNTGMIPAVAPESLGGDTDQDVVVYEHLEKEGITSEIITAKTANGLYDYLKSKGLKIESGSIPVLNNYIGKDYSFVASWINEKIITADDIKNSLNIYFSNSYRYPKFLDLIDSLGQKYPEFNHAGNSVDYLKSKEGETVLQELTLSVQNDSSILTDSYNRAQKLAQKGVFVTFPTKEIYFPLLPTSVYGDKTVPVTIRVIDHVTPKVFKDIKSYTKTEYYINDSYVFANSDLKNISFGNEQQNEQFQNIKYTKIEINAPSKFFTDDLWINNHAPAKTYYSTFFVEHYRVIAIILFTFSSIIAGILAGSVLFKELRRNPVKLGLIGLSNSLTILGLLITMVLVSTKNKNETIAPLLAEIRQKGYFWRRRGAVISFVAFPFLLLLALHYMDFVVLIIQIIFNIETEEWHIIFLFSPLAVLIVGYIIKEIKPEDKNLFEQLKLSGYSAWTFQPKDKLKIAFIPLFSVFFLVISWLLIELVKFTV